MTRVVPNFNGALGFTPGKSTRVLQNIGPRDARQVERTTQTRRQQKLKVTLPKFKCLGDGGA
jgi:hypothetical protein